MLGPRHVPTKNYDDILSDCLDLLEYKVLDKVSFLRKTCPNPLLIRLSLMICLFSRGMELTLDISNVVMDDVGIRALWL